MRSMLAATLMLASATGASAQMTTPQLPGTKPKVVQTVPIRPPALQTPSETADAMAQAERLSLQSDLAWVGDYNGAITGDVSARMVDAIKEYQKNKGGKPTGVLNPQERAALAETARRKQENVGWKIVTEPTSGARLGIPGKLVPQQATDANGSKWTSPTGTVQVLLSRRKEANPTTAKLAEAEKKEPAGRKVDYTVVKPDFFVLSGLQGLKKFYVRGTFKGDEVRIMTILYDQATENTVEPVVIAMSSAFNAFPSGQQAGPAPRKTVEYGTGIVVSDDGAIVTDRLVTDGCLAHHDRWLWPRRSSRRGQGARSRAAAHLWRARVEAAQPRERHGEEQCRCHRHRGSAEPGRRGDYIEPQGCAGIRRWRGCRAVAAAGRWILRRPCDRRRRQVLRRRTFEAGNGCRTCNSATGITGRDGLRGHRARFPEGERRHGERHVDGCESQRRARDLRAEVAINSA